MKKLIFLKTFWFFFSRFCDLCAQANHIESDLERQKWVASGGQLPECSEFHVGRKYSFARQITLPSPDIAKRQIENNFDISEKLNEAFATGVWKKKKTSLFFISLKFESKIFFQKGRVSAHLALFSKPRSVNKDNYCSQECGPGQVKKKKIFHFKSLKLE